MNSPIANRLQPSLLDRLTDRNPSQPKDPEGAYSISIEEYRRSVARDLRWLLGTCAPPEVQPEDGFVPPSDYYIDPLSFARAPETASRGHRSRWTDLRRFPRAARSVIAYGLRQTIGRSGPWEDRLRPEIERILLAFEPRIMAQSISVTVTPERQYLHMTIGGLLLAFPTSKDFLLRARIDRESSELLTW